MGFALPPHSNTSLAYVMWLFTCSLRRQHLIPSSGTNHWLEGQFFNLEKNSEGHFPYYFPGLLMRESFTVHAVDGWHHERKWKQCNLPAAGESGLEASSPFPLGVQVPQLSQGFHSPSPSGSGKKTKSESLKKAKCHLLIPQRADSLGVSSPPSNEKLKVGRTGNGIVLRNIKKFRLWSSLSTHAH